MANDIVGAPGKEESIFSGGLAGLLAATVFGGPIGAAVGLGTGLLADRMRRDSIDIAVDDQNAIHQYGSQIMQSIEATAPYVATFDPSYQNQFETIAEQVKRGSDLANHYDPKIRETGMQQLQQADANLRSFNEGLTARTNSLADREFAAQQKGADYYQGRIDLTQDKLREAQSLHDQAMYQINNLGPADPATKATLMNLIEMSPREADENKIGVSGGLPFGIGSASFDINSWKPTLDQAYKIAASVKETKIKSLSDYVGQLAQAAQQQGYTFTATKDGSIKVGTNINAVIQKYRAVEATRTDSSPAPANEQSTADKVIGATETAVNTVAREAGKVDLSQPGYTGAFLKNAYDSAASAGGKLVDEGAKAGSDAAAGVMQWIHNATNRTKKAKRPTN